MSLAGFFQPHRILYCAIGLFFLLHLYRITAPPNGYHQWRESDTAAVALNYYEEGMNFFEPHVNQRGATSGITGMELPVFNYTIALFYRLTGPYHVVAHLLVLLAACLSLWTIFKLTEILTDANIAAFSAVAMALSPLFFFYSYKIMPDIWALTLWLVSIYLYLQFTIKKKYLFWVVSALCLAVAGSIKPLGLSIYLPYLFLLWHNKQQTVRDYVLYLLYIAVTLGPFIIWIQYARYLQETSGLYAFYLGGNITSFYQYLFSVRFFKSLFLQYPPELWVGWVLVPVFFYGLYRAIKERTLRFVFVWILSIYIVFALTALKASTHDYYSLVIVPPLAVITGVGLSRLYLSGGWKRVTVVVLLLLAPVGVFLRIYHRFGTINDYYTIHSEVDSIIPRKDLVIVEDHTPAVRLYQLNRKGWTLQHGVRFEETVHYIKDGARFLLVKQPLDNRFGLWGTVVDTIPERLGPLYCYRAKDLN